MAESNESIMLRMGFDAAAVDQGLLKMEARAQNSAAKTKAIFAEADAAMAKDYQLAVEKMIAADEKHAAVMGEVQKEIAAGDAKTLAERQARSAAFEAARLAEIERVKEAQILANAEIIASEQRRNEKTLMMGRIYAGRQLGNGISPADMGQHAYGAFGPNAPENEGGGLGPGGKGGGSLSIMSREAMVMVREWLRGNWSRMLGSFTIFLNAMGGQMKKFIEGLFGMSGAIIGGLLATGYVMWEKIKAFNKSLDEEGKFLAESFGNREEAKRKALDRSAEAMAEQRAEMQRLADKHETLIHEVDRLTEAYLRQAAASEKLIQAEGTRQIAAINLAEHMGMMSPAEAAHARATASAATFEAVQQTKLGALADAVGLASSAVAGTEGAKGRLAANYQGANYLAFNSPSAIARQTAIAAHETAVAQLAKLKEQRKGLAATVDENDQSFYSAAARALSVGNRSLLPSITANQQYEQLQRTDALIKKYQDAIDAETRQHASNVETQKDLEEKVKEAKRIQDENNQANIDLTAKLKEAKEKYGDEMTAMQATRQNLIAGSLSNADAQATALAKMDRVNPTIEDLAGADYMKQLKELYGHEKQEEWQRDRRGRWHKVKKESGMYDLQSGTGYLAGVAQDYERSKFQQLYAISFEEGQYDPKTGKLIKGSDAYNAHQRMISDRQVMGVAGIETPEQQMESLIEAGEQTRLEIVKLNALIASGVPIKDGPGSGSTGGSSGD